MLSLPFLGIAPFVLYGPNMEKPWMCPIRAVATWSATCKKLGLRREGYMFRKKIGTNGVSSNGFDVMVSSWWKHRLAN